MSAAVLVDPRPKDFLEVCEDQGLDMCGIDEDTLATQPEVDQAEYKAFPEGAEEITGEFGDYPVRVLTGTRYPGESDERIALWQQMQADLAAEAADGEQTIIDGPHNLQWFRWKDVAAAIREVLP